MTLFYIGQLLWVTLSSVVFIITGIILVFVLLVMIASNLKNAITERFTGGTQQ